MPRLSRLVLALAACCLLLLAACAKNPVTGRSHIQFDQKSTSKMALQATQIANSMETSGSFLHDGKDEYRVIEIGQRLLAHVNDPDRDYRFFILKDMVPNAFAMADGTVVIHWGLYQALKGDDELAAVLGHEIGHVYSRHGEERESRTKVANAVKDAVREVAVSVAEDEVMRNPYSLRNWRRLRKAYDGGTPNLDRILDAGYLKPFSRLNEFEADSIGTLLATKAGFNPQSGVRLWERFDREVTRTKAAAPGLLDTHPVNAERVAAMRAMIPIAQRFGPGGDMADQSITRYAELLEGEKSKIANAPASTAEASASQEPLGQKDYK